MLTLQDYVTYEQIHENNRIIVYKGYAVRDRMPVIIKCLKNEATDPNGISKLIHEYEITRNLNIEGIIKPIKIEQSDSMFALISKDIGAVSLRKYIQSNTIELSQFLTIAIRLTETVRQLHQSRIIHRDLKPENILIDPATGNVYIIDFSSAVLFSEKGENATPSNNPAGTLEYMPPEQTGRLNLETDQRSDLYTLGVVFYEIITGQLPLQAEDYVGWIHAQIAQIPQSPDKIRPDIIPVISDIIMKLLSKNADERYQSTYGLWWDLKECERMLKEKGNIEYFSIGQADAPARCNLPRTLYGREREKKALEEAFDRVCEGLTETILVSGYPGIGKTMLINEGLKPVAVEKGYFISGKFDQLRHNIPYAPFASAFGNLIKQLMTLDKEELEQWKKRILYALGQNGAMITAIIPELEYIIGKQHPVDALTPKEAKNRFLIVFRHFIRAFAWKGHPLVLFLDDLQWADTDSINLLRYLILDANLNSMLIIGAFRENEVSGNPSLVKLLEDIRGGRLNIKRIPLSPLEREAVEMMVAETLHTDLEDTSALSELLFRKSGGNPLFLCQQLMLIYDEKLIYFDSMKGCWKWKLESIEKLEMGEDVLQIFLKKLQKLPKETIEVMKFASCIGNRFDLETLSAVYGKSMEETASDLEPSVREGFVIIAENQEMKQLTTYQKNKAFAFEFLHDRVQQAVYTLIEENERKERHLSIGRLLLQKAASGCLDEKIMPIMDHFNRSLELIRDPSERMMLAEYNLIAGRKAKASVAYAPALQYFRSGVELLLKGSWENAYTLCFDLHLELAQAEYLSANMGVAEKLFDIVILKARDELERASVYGLKVMLYAGMGDYFKAVHTGIYALRNLGVKLPLYPTRLDYMRELLLYKWHMRNKQVEDLINLPEMKDPVQKKIAELLSRLCSATIHSYPDLFGLIILKAGNHAVRYGNAEMAAVGYSGYCLTLGSVFGDYTAGDRFGKVSIQLAEKYDRCSSKCIIYFVIGAFATHWVRHASFALEYLKKAVQSGFQAGDLLIIGYAHCLLMEIGFLSGITLEQVAEEIHKKQKIAARLKHESLAVNMEIYDMLISILTGRKAVSLKEGIKEFQKDNILHLKQIDKSSQATYYICKMQLCYFAGNYGEALAAAKNGQPFMRAVLGFLVSAEYIFYYSLAITANYKEMSPGDRRHYRKILKYNIRQLKKWSETCKENFIHKYMLVAAEAARLQNRNQEAMSLYDKAIKSAQENGYIQIAALANELAAKFYLIQGLDKIARVYMSDACNGYNRWGAYSKVRALIEQYCELLDGIEFERQMDETVAATESMLKISTISDNETANALDMFLVDRAVESVSKEKDIHKLLESFLEIAIQSIGADRGFLILEKNGELFIEAMKDSNNDVTVIETVPLEENQKLSKAIVWYVARTLEDVVLNCEEHTGIFSSDSYIAENNPKSIACLPLLFQGIPCGVIYFENSFIPGVFVPERLEALKLFTTQIAYVKRVQSYFEKDNKENENAENSHIDVFLTERESEVLNFIAEGMSNKEIADKMDITINTVKGYIKNIYEKLGVNRRVQVVNKAKELKLLE